MTTAVLTLAKSGCNRTGDYHQERLWSVDQWLIANAPAKHNRGKSATGNRREGVTGCCDSSAWKPMPPNHRSADSFQATLIRQDV
jgi:hypothetical protein